MLPASHLSQLTAGRAKKALARLQRKIWSSRRALDVETTEAAPDRVDWSGAREQAMTPLLANAYWGRLYDRAWRRITLPDDAPAGAFLEWQDQGEATLYIDGEPYAGLDVAHRTVRLPEGARELWIESYCMQTGVWHPEAKGLDARGSHFTGAWLCERDEEAWAAWLDLSALVDCLGFLRESETPPLPANPPGAGLQKGPASLAPAHRILLHWLDRAIDALDVNGVAAMREVMAEAMEDLRAEKTLCTAKFTGHAHIDLVWLWTEQMGEAKAVHTFASQCRLLEQFPEMRFAYSQPASYEAVERLAPALHRKVKEKIAAGQWEATGALYVESDTQLACGEALARSFVLGQRGFEQLTGSPARLVWLPDVFGYTGCLPQLMRLSGVDYFFTTKLTWNAINHFPFSSFVWAGTDGSKVVAHVTQGVGYNNVVTPREVSNNAAMHAQLAEHREFLHPVGYGDGGGGPTEEMAERARRLSGLAGLPKIEWDQPEAFMARLAERRDALPQWKGECYLEYHRGTYTTHGNLKAAFRGLERALQYREAAAALLGQSADVEHAWKRLVFAQFHDYIPGSSAPEVYLNGVPELESLASEQVDATGKALHGKVDEACLFNPHAATWRGWVKTDDGETCVEIAPLCGAKLNEIEKTLDDKVSGAELTIENGRVKLCMAKPGGIESLMIDGEPLRLRPGAGQPIVYPDHPANFDAWDIDRAAMSLPLPQSEPQRMSVTVEPHEARIEVVYELGREQGNPLTLRYALRPSEAFVRITAELDWREEEALLRLEFPTEYRGAMARFGAPFGSTLRPQMPGNAYHEAQWEAPGNRWASVSHDGERDGLWLATESKYGFSAREGELGVSLVRSPLMTCCDPGHSGASPRGLWRGSVESPYSDQGRHVIELALGRYAPHDEALPHPARLADHLFTPPMVYRGAPVASALPVWRAGSTLIPAWVTLASDSARIIRFHEVGGQPGALDLDLPDGASATLVDLREAPLGDAQTGQARFEYGAYQIVSVKIG